jgi:hypothetical protein
MRGPAGQWAFHTTRGRRVTDELLGNRLAGVGPDPPRTLGIPEATRAWIRARFDRVAMSTGNAFTSREVGLLLNQNADLQ